MSPHSSNEYGNGTGQTNGGGGRGRDGLSPTVEMTYRRARPSPSPEPEPKPEISPEVEEALIHLKEEVSKCDWSNKGKFPPHMRPVVAEVAKIAIRTDCYTQPFFDRMPAIFPYNKFTITKLIRKEVHTFHTQFLADQRAALIAAFQKEVDAVKEDRVETHEAAVTAFGEFESETRRRERDRTDLPSFLSSFALHFQRKPRR
ncbi:hypothetical protein BDY24DRAFT_127195 [Mrakia frigida]|uniref:uncharacterized protein n=1 Tax=Mrakia frigida TaxID=29902 RepID=UPI003FCBFBD6